MRWKVIPALGQGRYTGNIGIFRNLHSNRIGGTVLLPCITVIICVLTVREI